MKILVINGSPKGDRSDVMRVTRAFVEGMGETAETINVNELTIKPCLGCFGCWHKTPGKCVQPDDMEALLQNIVSSDLVIWSMPLYCFGMPSGIKAIIDRMIPLATPSQAVDDEGNTYHPLRGESPTRMMLISGSGFPDIKGNFDGLIFQAKRMFGENIPMILCVESPLMNIKEAAPVTDIYLANVREAGSAYKREGCIPEALQAKLDAPMLPPDEYRRGCN